MEAVCRNVLLLIVLVVCFTPCHLVSGAMDKTVCHPPPVPTSGPPLNKPLIPPPTPILPDEFEAHIVLNILSRNCTTELHQFFSYIEDHSVIEQRQFGQRYYGYADYKTNEFLGIFPDTRQCTVSNLATNPNKFLFGYKKNTDGGSHVTHASQLLHAFQKDEDTTTIYLGNVAVRGIPTNVWYTCTYWRDEDATMNVYWYFSDPNKWTPSSTTGSIPVRAEVQGRRYLTPGNFRDFEHKYDFFHWKTKNLRKNYWQTPRGISCPGRINSKSIPGIPTQFSFVLEQVDSDLGFVSFMKEWYDKSQGLFRFQYRAGGSKAQLFGNTVLSEVHDYNSGIAYVMDPNRGNCSIMPIETTSLDDRQTSTKTVRLRTALEFFFLDGVKPSYEGVKQIRGVDADIWVATRPSHFGSVNDTWEWAFTKWNSEEEEESFSKEPIPMQLTLREGRSATYFNMYHFKREEPSPSTFDISPCFENRNRRIFSFGIAAFKQGVSRAVVSATKISPSRVAHVAVNIEDHPVVTLELLDIAPISGDVKLKAPQVSLKNAGDRLYNAIRTNSFQIFIGDGPDSVNPVTIKAEPSQVKENEYQQVKRDKGVTTVTTVAVGIVTAVVGAALGGGVAVPFHQKVMTPINT